MERAKNLDTAMNFIGWGDPHRSIWFFGIEEGARFTQEHIDEIDGKAFVPVSNNDNLNWPVANKTARILSYLAGHRDFESYRDEILWRKGRGSFNGNLLPLGKASRKEWAQEYEQLFGLSEAQRGEYMRLVRDTRYPKIRDLRERCNPQAIVCFGKECWADFRHIFVENPHEYKKYKYEKIETYPRDKVILCGHFSYGVHFTNKALGLVVEILRNWGAYPNKT